MDGKVFIHQGIVYHVEVCHPHFMKALSRRHLFRNLGLVGSCAIASAASLFMTQSGSAADNPLKVFIFAGQSNMVGQESQTRLLPYNLRGKQIDVLFWHGKNWKTYTAGMGQGSGFGPEVSCGFELARALGEPVGMIKLSVGGSDLYKEWNPSDSQSHYSELKKQVEAARVSRQIEVVGMFWMQGEADAHSVIMSMSYSRNLNTLIAKARSDFRNREMVFISGRVNSRTSPYLGVVRRSQEQGRRAYGWIDLDRLPKFPDRVHYDTRGIIEMGKMFAKKFTLISGPR